MFSTSYRDSSHRTTTYDGIVESASAGLHEKAFGHFRQFVSPGAKVLDLGSGMGAWAKRLHDGNYNVTACDLDADRPPFDFPYMAVNLNQDFGGRFAEGGYDAVTIIEVIEHLENPRHVFRQIKQILRQNGIVLLTTPNASGVYSRLRFFFTGEMAMFSNDAYVVNGHITPLTAWHLDKVIREQGFTVLRRGFHDAPFLPPRSSADLAKIIAWTCFRPLMFGAVGGQNLLFVLKNEG